MSKLDPLAILLVKDGERGNKTLFQYPFQKKAAPSKSDELQMLEFPYAIR